MWCEQATPEAAHLLVSIFHLQLIAYFYDFANAIAYFYNFANADALGCASVCDKLVTESFSSFLPLHNSLFHPLTDFYCFLLSPNQKLSPISRLKISTSLLR